MSKCPPCQIKQHSSCLKTLCDCKMDYHVIVSDPSLMLDSEDQIEENLDPQDDPNTNEEEEEVRGSITSGKTSRISNSKTGRIQKRDATLKDQQSTGRKRAARLYPLKENSPCEWQGHADCGGGNYPIIGCISGKQQARHHGPDKSTSNNEEGNVHRICHRCHNRWHAANNKHYDWTSTTVKNHAPRPQTPEEKEQALLDELIYHGSKQKRIKD